MQNPLLKKLDLPIKSDRPYFYTSFVSTLDGKVFVKKPGYWPIGSDYDYKYFTWLRAHADGILDGTGTAIAFGERTIQTIHEPEFNALRKKAGRLKPATYLIMTNQKIYLQKTLQITLQKYAYQPQFLPSIDNLKITAKKLKKQGYNHIYIDGGPTLLGSFIKEGLLDEIFLTLAPKVFGSEKQKTMTMIENTLFKSNQIPSWKLMSINSHNNEVFLRYIKR